MEALSPTMEEGRLVKWLKNEGDQVKSGDILAEVETDKAVMELVARGDGVVRKRLANEGDASPVGTLLAVIGAPDENIDAIVSSAGPASKPAEAEAPPAAPGGEASAGEAPAQAAAPAPAPQPQAPAAVAPPAPPPPPPPAPAHSAPRAPVAAPTDGRRPALHLSRADWRQSAE